MAGLADVFRNFFTWIRSAFGRTAEQSAGFAIGQAAHIALRPLFMSLAYEINNLLPIEKAAIADYLEAYIRGYISLDQLHSNLHDLGLGDTTIDFLIKLRDPLLNVGDITTLYNRGKLSKENAIKRLMQIGYSQTEAEELLSLGRYIPTVADFVRFAVREVFTPETAEKYGQFQDYPPQFEEYATKAGLDPEYAKYYWAAHWDLPSATQGFEMYHRGIITLDELKTLLKALDVMPYWRDKLIQLAITPYTRVDVRRMYKAGVLTRDEVKKAYQDLGYDETKAEKLTQWTVNESTQETRDLTKAEIVALYKDSVIPESQARDLIKSLGYSDEETELILKLTDFKRNQERLSILKSALEKVYISGVVNRNDVLIFLEKYGFPASEVQDLLDLWDLKASLRFTLPSKTDCDKFYQAGLIKDDEYRNLLRGLGYADQFIDWYLVLNKGKLKTEETKE